MLDPFEVIDAVRAPIHHSGLAGDEKSTGLPTRITVRCEKCDEEFMAMNSNRGTPGTFMKTGLGYLVVCKKGEHRGTVQV